MDPLSVNPPQASGTRQTVITVCALVGVAAATLPIVLQSTVQVLSSPSSVLLLDIAIFGIVGTVTAVRGRRTATKHVVPIVWCVCGALIGAAFIGPLRVLPWTFAAIAAFGVLGCSYRSGGVRGFLLRSALLTAAAFVNFALLWPFLLGKHRPVPPAEFQALDLRIHTLMADVPVHDVWVARLSGVGGGGGFQDLDEALSSYGPIGGDDRVALAAVLGVYLLVSYVFDWHDDECIRPEAAIRQRLTEADRRRSDSPSDRGPFLYRFEMEAAIELQTCAGHAVYAYAIAPDEDGLLLYWAAYSLPVGWFTPLYMAIVDPVRTFIVFPALLERFEHAWHQRWDQDRRSGP